MGSCFHPRAWSHKARNLRLKNDPRRGSARQRGGSADDFRIVPSEKNWPKRFAPELHFHINAVFLHYQKNCGFCIGFLSTPIRAVPALVKNAIFVSLDAKFELFFSTIKLLRRSGEAGTMVEMQCLGWITQNIIHFSFFSEKYELILTLPPAASRPDFEGVHFFFDFEKILNFPQGFIFEL